MKKGINKFKLSVFVRFGSFSIELLKKITKNAIFTTNVNR
ncbi:hypothetical protein JCM19301_3727 [Jejuia pallidilutea]|uniref:Uncharacterized protein n=1 Tax=Jejuia pallidilutea TaxID=504487 RepID=A0A090WCJ9_9FLAO|nr:hypothetical protein JCM19301_3727 [Jejuia pallidilutea]GAL89144.1 hypothetical protein JCM19538_2133 [Jejuia pallidilutea]